MSELQSELKLKKFELERLSILYSEVNEKYKDTLLEKERLAEKLDVCIYVNFTKLMLNEYIYIFFIKQ